MPRPEELQEVQNYGEAMRRRLDRTQQAKHEISESPLRKKGTSDCGDSSLSMPKLKGRYGGVSYSGKTKLMYS
jgi:hypothetical protein